MAEIEWFYSVKARSSSSKGSRRAAKRIVSGSTALSKKDSVKTNRFAALYGVHPTRNTKTIWGWIKNGVRKTIPMNTGRQRIHLSGALDINKHGVLI
ncbi:MAG: hypothetical protein AAGF04_03420 [Chlamydiota bacterium]